MKYTTFDWIDGFPCKGVEIDKFLITVGLNDNLDLKNELAALAIKYNFLDEYLNQSGFQPLDLIVLLFQLFKKMDLMA